MFKGDAAQMDVRSVNISNCVVVYNFVCVCVVYATNGKKSSYLAVSA